MWVKICGTTSLEDAQLAASLGADALGFIFAPSKRRVTAAQVGAITPHLPTHIERVGVFQSESVDEIVRTVGQAGLTTVQIHGVAPTTTTAQRNTGHEEASAAADLFASARQLSEVVGDRVRLIQVLHWPVMPSPTEASSIAAQISALTQLPGVDRVLVDSRVGAAGGGTGVPFDWNAAHATLARIPSNFRLILAGGLNCANVTEAVRVLKPWGLDVVTGVESAPGRKDRMKLAEFMKQARG